MRCIHFNESSFQGRPFSTWFLQSALQGRLLHSPSPVAIALSMHYDDVIMTTIASQITSLTVVYAIVYSGVDQRKHQSSAHWPLCGEFTGPGEFPAQKASNAENISIWLRHHEWGIRHDLWLVSVTDYLIGWSKDTLGIRFLHRIMDYG